MKLILLAAGKGERLLPLTKERSKLLLDMGNGKTLLDEQFENIKKSGVIDEVVLIVGFMAEQIEEKVRGYSGNGIRVKTIYNPFYELSNNLISLWFARGEMDGGFMVSNGDNLFNASVYRSLAQSASDGVYITISRKERYDFDDMKATLGDGKVARIGKDIEGEVADAEPGGLSLVSGARHAALFSESLDGLVKRKENMNKFWLEVFNFMRLNGVDIRPYEIDGERNWRELDYHLDIEQVKRLIKMI